ncbi:nibrin-like [Artemia franciscana]
MNQIMLTIKVCLCLISCKPIVKPDYFEAVVKTCEADPSNSMPEPKGFEPICNERNIDGTNVSFSPNPARRNLFAGKTFYFTSAGQAKRLSEIIKAASGCCDLISESILSKLHDLETIVLLPEGAGTQRITQDVPLSPLHSRVFDKLQRLGKKPIPESHVPLAIAWASTSQYCNPSFRLNDIIRYTTPKKEPQSIPNTDILAVETQVTINSGQRDGAESLCVPPTNYSDSTPRAGKVTQASMQDSIVFGSVSRLGDETIHDPNQTTMTKRRRSPDNVPSPKRPHFEASTSSFAGVYSTGAEKRLLSDIKTEPTSDDENAGQPLSKRLSFDTQHLTEGIPTSASNFTQIRSIETLGESVGRVQIKEQDIKKENDEPQNEVAIVVEERLIRQKLYRPTTNAISGNEKRVNFKRFKKQPIRRDSSRTIQLGEFSQSFDLDRERRELEEGIAEEPVELGERRIQFTARRQMPLASPFVLSRRDSQTRSTNQVTPSMQLPSTSTGTYPGSSRLGSSTAPPRNIDKGGSLFQFRNERRNR